MSTVWQTTNKSRMELRSDIKTLLDAASAIDWLGPKTSPVLLKPNLVVSKPASGGATTHPEIAAGIIEYLKDSGYSNIAVAEGSWVGDSTTRAFRICGYGALAEKYNIKLIDLQKDSPVNVSIRGESFKICATIASLPEEGGSLINLPVLKGHGQTLLTCALKNMKGCIPDTEKRRYHSLGVHRPVAMINTVIKPAFSLVDGLNGDPTWEEGGSPEKRDLLLLGRDPVSLDVHSCRLLNIAPESVSYIALADELGVGSADISEADIVYLNNAAQQTTKENTVPRNQKDTEIRAWINSIVDQRSACSACFGNLAQALKELYEEKGEHEMSAEFPRDKKSILIGQDFKGMELPDDKTGIGICTCGKEIFGNDVINNNIAFGSLKGCPPSQAAIKKYLS